jgi:hypothetical protein
LTVATAGVAVDDDQAVLERVRDAEQADLPARRLRYERRPGSLGRRVGARRPGLDAHKPRDVEALDLAEQAVDRSLEVDRRHGCQSLHGAEDVADQPGDRVDELVLRLGDVEAQQRREVEEVDVQQGHAALVQRDGHARVDLRGGVGAARHECDEAELDVLCARVQAVAGIAFGSRRRLDGFLAAGDVQREARQRRERGEGQRREAEAVGEQPAHPDRQPAGLRVRCEQAGREAHREAFDELVHRGRRPEQRERADRRQRRDDGDGAEQRHREVEGARAAGPSEEDRGIRCRGRGHERADDQEQRGDQDCTAPHVLPLTRSLPECLCVGLLGSGSRPGRLGRVKGRALQGWMQAAGCGG